MAGRTRRDRTPFSANRTRLAVKFNDPDFDKKYVYRWFNDVVGRCVRAEEAGYEFVTPDEIAGGTVGDPEVTGGNTDLNSKVSRIVTGARNGNPEVRAYLMKIRREWYDQDQTEKQKINNRVDQAIRAGKAGGAELESEYGNVDVRGSSAP